MKHIKVSGHPSGEVTIPSSKSVVHRMMICAAMGNRCVKIGCKGAGDDIFATADCLKSLGAKIEILDDYITLSPIDRSAIGNEIHHLECNESGSTLRFMLPVAAALGAHSEFHGKGRLPERPLSPLYEEMVSHGIELGKKGVMPLSCKGKLPGGTYTIDGGGQPLQSCCLRPFTGSDTSERKAAPKMSTAPRASEGSMASLSSRTEASTATTGSI